MHPTPRLATPADRQAIEAIVQQAYSPYIARMGRPPGPMLDDYAALIDAGRVRVVETNGVVQGLLVLIPEAEAMLLHNVAVASAARGTGLGHHLLEYAEQAARASGYRIIRLYTNETMTENIARYTRIGYVETHREPDGMKRVFMSKPLTA
ncbi:GNAT family N-acetyltransferase [Burkholderia gladioli]|uniref:GNAT family N-acetyltransferase n=3 Tax=Burkholderia gladioli TaxID=28095 RepID=UPI001640A1ED|nr:GNAT family N-acetyltransferase [Burkholderia gladioli]